MTFTPITRGILDWDVPLNAALTSFDTTVTAAVPKGSLVLNVKDYGALGDGTTNDTAAIQAAVTALGANGGTVFFPPGVYRVAGTITANADKIHFEGAGIGATTIRTTSATLPVFDFGDNVTLRSFLGVRDLMIDTSVTRTAGAFIRARNTADLNLERMRLDGAYYGIDFLNVQITRLTDLHIINCVAAVGEAIRVDSTGTGSNLYLNRVATDAPVGLQPRCGLSVKRFDGVFLTDTQFNHSGYGAILEPPAAQTLDHIWASNCSFDTNSGSGLLFNTGGGTVRRAWFSNCWFGTNDVNGVNISGGAQAVTFIQPKVNNNGQHGIAIVDATDVEIVSPHVSGSARLASGTYDGIFVAANQSRIKVLGGDIRPISGFANTQRRAITITAGTSDYITVANVNVDGNVNAIGISNGGTGVNNLFRNNRGYVTENKGTVVQAGAAGNITVTHGLAVTPTLKDITVTAGTDLGAAPKFYVDTIGATTFQINTSGAPGADVTWGWRVQV